MNEIQGKIDSIIYANENSFKIMRVINSDVENKGEMIFVKGTFPNVEKGDNIKCRGVFEEHAKYGIQFKSDSFDKTLPKADDEIIKFLSKNFTGVGEKIASRMLDKFGEDVFKVITHSPEKLLEIKGMNESKIDIIQEEYNQKFGVFELAKSLKKYELSIENITKLHELWQENAEKIIKENPYILLKLFSNVKFQVIDKEAIASGYDKSSIERVKACIGYLLNIAMANGNTCVIENDLIVNVQKQISLNIESIEFGIKELITEGIIIKFKKMFQGFDEEIDVIQYKDILIAEENIAKKLISIRDFKVPKIKTYIDEVEKLEKSENIVLTEEQKEAIFSINENNVNIITGGPGTGKTTIIKFIISVMKSVGKTILVAAPTGKAAKRITEVTGHKASTIHRLLEINKYNDNNTNEINRAIYQEIELLDCDILVVDEASMIDIYLMNYIVKAISVGIKIIIIGDKDQLQSVGPGSILKDLIESQAFNVKILNTIFRQANRSNIIINAHRVNNGDEFQIFDGKDSDGLNYLKDVEFIESNSPIDMRNKLINLLNNIEDKDEFFLNSQILSITKQGMCGTIELNKTVQEVVNKKTEYINTKKVGNTEYREFDRIMQIKNDYDKRLVNIDGSQEIGIFNGETGYIKDIDNTNKYLTIAFDDGKEADYVYEDLQNIFLSYVITVHKSQGSEFDTVILVVPNANNLLLRRNVLYTAITRAKKKLIILASKSVITFMINNLDLYTRKTNLSQVIKSKINREKQK